MNGPRASVVVLNWNGREHLTTCLSSLCAQVYPSTEVVLIDNGSTDGSPAYVREAFPSVRVVELPTNVGVTPALNVGIRHSRGEYIGMINNDTEADVQWVTESVRALETYPQAGFTASRIRLFYQRSHLDTAGDQFFWTGHPAKRGWLAADGPEYDRPAWVFGSCGAAAFYRRAMFDDIGSFDEDFFAVFEDIDLSFRAQLMGYQCRYVPSAVVYHKVGATRGIGAANLTHYYRIHRNRWFVLIKNLPGALWLRYFGPILAAEAAMLAAAASRARIKVALQARAEVLRRLPRFLEKRRSIQSRRRVSDTYIDSLVARGWTAHRRAEKQREAVMAQAPRPMPPARE